MELLPSVSGSQLGAPFLRLMRAMGGILHTSGTLTARTKRILSTADLVLYIYPRSHAVTSNITTVRPPCWNTNITGVLIDTFSYESRLTCCNSASKPLYQSEHIRFRIQNSVLFLLLDFNLSVEDQTIVCERRRKLLLPACLLRTPLSSPCPPKKTRTVAWFRQRGRFCPWGSKRSYQARSTSTLSHDSPQDIGNPRDERGLDWNKDIKTSYYNKALGTMTTQSPVVRTHHPSLAVDLTDLTRIFEAGPAAFIAS